MTRFSRSWYEGRKESKYHNKKVVCDGETFDSLKELRRWNELKLMQSAGEISGLKRQVEFNLIPRQDDEYGKMIERPCNYVADFVYALESDRSLVVEDAKSEATRTPAYVIKRKLMLQIYGIRIREV